MSACTTPAVASPRSTPAQKRGAWVAWLARMIRTVSTRGQLVEMDERMLRDVGLTRHDARREMMRKPWDL